VIPYAVEEDRKGNKSMVLRSAFLTLTILVCAVPLWGQQSATPEEPAWRSLFNGEDLTGWKIHGEEDWRVEDGVIVSQSIKGGYGYLATEKAYRDFSLKVRFKCEAEGNSGVFFHSTLDGTDIRGIQAEVDPRGNTAGLYESGGRGWLAQPDPALQEKFRQDAWNEMEVTVVGNRITTRLNGHEGVDYTDPEPRFEDGKIALQLHSGGGVRVLWKDLRIRDLPPSPPSD